MTPEPSWWVEARAVILAGVDRSPDARSQVEGVLELALQGTGGPLHTSDGRRMSPLTPTGAPIEVKLASRNEGVAYTAVAGISARYFGPRLRAERASAQAAASHLSAGGRRIATEEAERLVGAIVTDPRRVSPRATHGTYLGVVHDASGRLSGVRVYANLRLGPGTDFRSGRGWASFDRLGAVIRGLPVEPMMAAVHVDEPRSSTSACEPCVSLEPPARVHKLYVRLPRRDPVSALHRLATRASASADDLVARVADLGFGAEALGRGALVAVRTHPDGTAVELALHLTRRVLGEGAGRWRAARCLATGPVGSATMAARLEEVRQRATGWEVSVLALGTDPEGRVSRSCAYLAPAVARPSL